MGINIKEKMLGKISDEGKRERMEKRWEAAKKVKNIACWILIGILTLTMIVVMITRINGGMPSLFGVSLQRVSSGSMEPYLHVGDVIVSKDVDDAQTLEEGDVITFQGGAQFEYRKVTHRVYKAPYLNSGGEWVLVTKGDANSTDDGEILLSDVRTRMLTKIGFLRPLYSFFFSPFGLVVIILLIILIFFDEILNVVRISSGKYSEEDEESINDIIERILREDEEKKLVEAKRDSENTDETDSASDDGSGEVITLSPGEIINSSDEGNSENPEDNPEI